MGHLRCSACAALLGGNAPGDDHPDCMIIRTLGDQQYSGHHRPAHFLAFAARLFYAQSDFMQLLDVLEADNHVWWAEGAAHTHVISRDCESNFIPHVQEDVRKMEDCVRWAEQMASMKFQMQLDVD